MCSVRVRHASGKFPRREWCKLPVLQPVALLIVDELWVGFGSCDLLWSVALSSCSIDPCFTFDLSRHHGFKICLINIETARNTSRVFPSHVDALGPMWSWLGVRSEWRQTISTLILCWWYISSILNWTKRAYVALLISILQGCQWHVMWVHFMYNYFLLCLPLLSNHCRNIWGVLER